MLTTKEKEIFKKYSFWKKEKNEKVSINSFLPSKMLYDPCGSPTCGCETGCRCSIGCGGPEKQKHYHETPLLNIEI